jgi:hypothetical protein
MLHRRSRPHRPARWARRLGRDRRVGVRRSRFDRDQPGPFRIAPRGGGQDQFCIEIRSRKRRSMCGTKLKQRPGVSQLRVYDRRTGRQLETSVGKDKAPRYSPLYRVTPVWILSRTPTAQAGLRPPELAGRDADVFSFATMIARAEAVGPVRVRSSSVCAGWGRPSCRTTWPSELARVTGSSPRSRHASAPRRQVPPFERWSLDQKHHPAV